MKIFTMISMLAATLFISGCASTKTTQAQEDNAKSKQNATASCPLQTDKSGDTKKLCLHCGEVKGSAKCCKPTAKKCGACKLTAGSPGCCKIPKGTKKACINTKTNKVSTIK